MRFTLVLTKLNRIKSSYYHPFCGLSVRIVFFLGLIWNLLLMYPYLSAADSVSTSDDLSPEKYMMQGLKSFQRGAFEQAIPDWKVAVRLYEENGEYNKQSEVLILLSQAYQSIGQYGEALKSLNTAQVLAEKSGDRLQIASVLGNLGNIYIAIGPAGKAYQHLNESLAIAKEIGDSDLSAAILNNLGNLFTIQKKYTEAIGAYSESMTLAKKSNNYPLAARALSNAAIASMQKGQYTESKALLDMALEQTRNIEPLHEKAYGLINIGLTYYNLCPHFPDHHDLLLRLSYQTFNEAATIAETIGDLRAESYAWGYLGKLYEDEHRYQEALGLTRHAIFASQQVNAPESLYLWQWQTGRLLKVLGNINDAIYAYRNAIHTLQSIRQEMSQCYGSPQLSFRESIGPVYFGLVDLLLQRAASLKISKEYESYLIEARETVELLKIAELRDYFQDDCLDVARSRTTRLDIVSKTAVVIYPIVFPDRIELLVSLPAGLKRFLVQVGSDTLSQEVRKFRAKLEKRTTREYLPHAQTLYDWLIRPLEPDLDRLTIDTLVFVPDGPLRTIPMAALHDGKNFLISKYAVAITPGLNLTDPRPIKRENIKILAAGLTDSVQGFPPLPDVSTELQAVQNFYTGKQLLNQQFLTSVMEKELRDKQFTVLHIASHGQFESDIQKTFLLTFDNRLTMDQFDQFVGFYRFREEPLELLTLSACETATGDDRAALGLAGVAVKAGARSALATLWSINDKAASLLVAEFYRQLQDSSCSRAAALQRAQVKLLNDRSYQHPAYWSPFLLINNWL